MRLFYAVPGDIDAWMGLVERVRWNFPGLETQEQLQTHRQPLLPQLHKIRHLH